MDIEAPEKAAESRIAALWEHGLERSAAATALEHERARAVAELVAHGANPVFALARSLARQLP